MFDKILLAVGLTSGLYLVRNLYTMLLVLPDEAAQGRATDHRLRWMEERTEGKHARGTNIIPFSMHQIDELLEEVDLAIEKSRVIESRKLLPPMWARFLPW